MASVTTDSPQKADSPPQDPVTEREARKVAEAARETEWKAPSFVRELFSGRVRLELIHPFPEIDQEELERARPWLEDLDRFLAENVDAEEIDRTYKIPQAIVDGLKERGCMGIKIPREYGGLGFSQAIYNRAMSMVAAHESSISVLLSAHQSIGVPQPLKLFGTPEQKKKYLPRLAKGAISAFALTEPDVGSDPARMTTSATLTDDGTAYLLNGEKLWCTNGTIAELMVVMARTPDNRITAFIVEAAWEGVEVAQRCSFMGLHGIENALLRFTNVRVPKENILWGEGKGLKLALITLNTGRLTIPASAAAAARACVGWSREFCQTRVQWGHPIGKHDAIAQRLGAMAATTFAMDSIAELSALMSDQARFDIRLEAAMAKMWNTEQGWETIDSAVQIRSGRAYETASSLAARGEEPIPLERIMRDFRINMIFEGTSEIMRLFVAREVVDTHLKVAGAIADPEASMGDKIAAVFRAIFFYAVWYPARWLGWGWWPRYSEFGGLAKHMRYVNRTSRKLARTLFHSIIRFGPKLEKRQSVLFRLVEVGAELFAMSATIARVQKLKTSKEPEERAKGATAEELAARYCDIARRRIKDRFKHVFNNDDVAIYKTAQRIMSDEMHWLEYSTEDAWK